MRRGTLVLLLVFSIPILFITVGLFKVSRVLAHLGIIPTALTTNHHRDGPWQETLESVPPPWLDWALRWRRLSTLEPTTVRSRFAIILIAGRWAAERHPEALSPDLWARIEWEWIKPRFDPRKVLSLPLSVHAQIGPNPRIIDDASWAKLMAAGITLNAEDLNDYGTPSARAAPSLSRFVPARHLQLLRAGSWPSSVTTGSPLTRPWIVTEYPQ